MDYVFAVIVVAVIIVPIVGGTLALALWLGKVADAMREGDDSE